MSGLRNHFQLAITKAILLTVFGLLAFTFNVSAQQPCDIIYVSPSVTVAAAGTPTAPTTLINALTQVSGTRVNIRMLEGTYTITQVLNLVDNVRIDGGYRVDGSGNWVKRSDVTTTINMSGSSTFALGNPFNYTVGQNIGFSANSTSNWALESLTINVASNSGNTGGYGNSVYGVYINNATGYTISRCVINTGSGGEGLGGSTPGGSGGAGGAGSGGAGGAGGQGCGDSNAGGTGTQGSGVVNGGTGGNGMSPGCNFLGCDGNQRSGNNGANGDNGSAGSGYSAGSPATTPAPSVNLYTPGRAASGGNGTAGGGGGGGGGATGGTCVCAGCSGPGGGNGGGGGNAGVGGSGGYGGGGSFAVYAYGGTGTILDCALNPGNGGPGGAGAAGQSGTGGSGGSNGGSNTSCLCGSNIYGGVGGTGGTGGNGGRGQDGATGASIALVQLNSASVTRTGTTVPNPTLLTVNYGNTSACTNSEITITKAAGTWVLPSGVSFSNDLTPTTSSYGTSSATAVIVANNSGLFDIGTGGAAYRNFLNINTLRSAAVIDPLGNVTAGGNTLCANRSITLSTPTVGDQYEWKVYSDASGPSAALYTYTTQNPGNTGVITTIGHYYVRLRVHTVCCGWSAPVFSGFTVTVSPNVTLGADRYICGGGNVILTATGTTGNYLWNTGATTASITVSPSSTTSYSVTVSDASICQGSDTITVFVSTGLTVSGFTNLDASCAGGNNGQSTAQITGGFSPFTYSWSSGAAGPTATNLAPGSYSVTVHDVANCSATGSTTIGTAPPVVITNIGVGNILCNGTATGTIAVTANGGTGGLQYSSNGINYQSSNILANLPAGFYTVYVKDGNGCSAQGTATITQPSSAINISNVAITDVLCNGSSTGRIVISATGGNGTLRYSINNGTNYQTSNTFTGLVAGTTYNIIVRDANNCTTTYASNPVSISQPAALVLSIDSTKNLTCNGVSNGIIYSTATGGAGSYQYSYNGSPYQVSGTFTGLAAGTHTLIVQDANTCSQSAVVTITQPTVVNITNIASTNVLCNGALTGTITVTASGGTGTLQYSLNTGAYQASNAFTAVGAGVYIVNVKDANGCTKTGTVTITQPATAVSLSNMVVTNVLCNGGTGSIVVTASGGTGTVTYSINGGTSYQASGTFSGLTAGTNYNVQVKDANNCVVSYVNNPVSITQPTALTLSIDTAIDIICNGVNSGRIVVSSTGGAGGNTYSINGGPYQAGTAFGNLAGGAYTVTVKDANNCTKTASVTLSQPSAIVISNIAVGNLQCNGVSTGSLTITASGGTGTLQYSINGTTFQASNVISSLPAGNYTVTVKDDNGCTKTSTAIITQPATAVTITNVASTSAACNGGTGSITVTASGGTGNLQYTINGTNYQASNVFTGLIAGQYNVAIRDANGCALTYANNPINISNPSGLAITITGTTDATCFGGSNGTATVTATGGSLPYQFSINGGPLQTATTFNNLLAGNYSILVRDANGCTDAKTAVIGQPALVSISNIASSNVACNGASTGSITITATGGTGTLTYSINGINFQASNVFSGLPAGGYSVTVKDANGCSTTGSATVTQPTTAVSITNVSKVNVACNGGTTGSISISAVGGTGALSYSTDGTTFQANNNVTGLGVGSYTVIVKDANGCTVNYAANPVVITEPTALTLAIDSVIPVSCRNGSTGKIYTSAHGGTTAYQFSLDGGPLQSGSTFTGLATGTYTVLVRDANGCSVTATAFVAQPSQLGVTDVVTNVSCSGSATGAISATGTGGTGPYNFAWSTGQTNLGVATSTVTGLTVGSYFVTITDAAGCSINKTYNITGTNQLVVTKTVNNVACYGGNNGSIRLAVTGGTPGYTYQWTGGASTLDSLSGLTIGTYNATVTDLNGCSVTTSASITQPDSIGVVGQVVNVTCNGQNNGGVFLTITGGTPSYTYQWTGGIQTQNLVSQPAGTYSVTVTDRNGCTNTKTYTITEPPVFKVTLTHTDNTCFGGNTGTMAAGVAGGTAPYSYQWSNGPSTPSISNLVAGVYSVVVRDANGCTVSESDTVHQPTAITLSGSVTNPTCAANNGAVTVTAVGGTGPYNFTWSNGHTENGVTSSTITGIGAATYTVTVTDAASCSVSSSYTVQQSSTITATSVVTPALCNGGATGSITVNATGGVAPYTYAWSSGSSTNAVLNNLAAGPYTVTVTDALGCTVSQINNVTQPAALSIQSNVTNVGCSGNLGSILLTVSGGTPGYTYSWNGGTTTGNLTNLNPGTYSVTVKDNNNCTATDTYTITGISGPQVQLHPTNAACSGGNNGSVKATVTSGLAPYTFQWSNGNITDSIGGLAAGQYSVVVTDANHCTVTASVNITTGTSFSFTIAKQDVGCLGGTNTGRAIAIITGGTQPFQYAWSNDNTLNDSINDNLVAGGYGVTISDLNGCSASQTFTINEAAPLLVNIGKHSVYLNVGDNVALTPTVTRTGTFTYSWTPAKGLNDATLLNVTATPTEPTLYTLVVTEVGTGCTGSDTVNITVSRDWFVANVFTPNGDFLNDDFTVTPRGDNKLIEFRIYNRYGQKVFDRTDIPWDGKVDGAEQPTSTFVYEGVIEKADGSKVAIKGDVTLIR